MNITIALHPNHLPAWAAKASETGKTEPELVQSIIDSHGEIFTTSLIQSEKAKYDEFVTLAASLSEAKKKELIAYVQSLAEGPADGSQA
jgi:hypothetical protein